jgi:Ca2+-binding RTX toxin-like protein
MSARVGRRLVAVLIAAAAFPAAAGASTARIGPFPDSILQPAPSAIIVAGGAEANGVAIVESGSDTIVTDTAGVTPADATCQAVSPTQVRCPQPAGSPSLLFDVRLGEGNDTLSITLTGAFTFGRALMAGGDDRVRFAGDLGGEQDGGPGNDVLAGGPRDDRLRGGDGVDRLGGEAGQDRLDGGLGGDVLVGGEGTDTYEYGARTTPVSVTFDGNANDGAAGEGDRIVAAGDDIEGGSAGDFLAGDGLDNRIDGGGGNDVVFGAGGSDRLTLANGDDFGDGGDGADVIDAGAGSDHLRGGGGDDTLHAGLRPDEPDGSPDRVEGGAGVDTYDIGFFDTSCAIAPGPHCIPTKGAAVTLDDVANDNGEGDDIRSDVETLRGSGLTDFLIGSGAGNAILGDGGGDRIAGRGGNDLLLGQTGNDFIDSRDGLIDAVDCGPGSDFVLADPLDILQGCESVSLPPA